MRHLILSHAAAIAAAFVLVEFVKDCSVIAAGDIFGLVAAAIWIALLSALSLSEANLALKEAKGTVKRPIVVVNIADRFEDLFADGASHN